MATFKIKRNDTSPAIDAILERPAGTVVPVTGATVRFKMRDSHGNVIVDELATVVDGAAGHVRYSWAAADTITAGLYQAEFEVTYVDSSIETFPNEDYITVKISEDI